MSELDQRVTRLEYEMAEARYLARKADKDVSDYRAVLHGHTSVLNSLRETQVEHGIRLDRLEHKVDGLEHKVDGLEHKVDGLERRLDEGFSMVNENFTKVDENFAKVDENFARIDREFAKIRQGLTTITGLLTDKLDEDES